MDLLPYINNEKITIVSNIFLSAFIAEFSGRTEQEWLICSFNCASISNVFQYAVNGKTCSVSFFLAVGLII